MVLTPGIINAYKELMINPTLHGLSFKSLSECFEVCEKVTPKDILYEQYLAYLQRPLPKVVFYIIMDELYWHLVAKDEETKDLGYRLKLIVE